MRFAFIAKNAEIFSIERLCQIMDVSPRGYRAYRSRPLSQSQRKDMVVLAHIREQFALSLGSYGRPRMTEELKELGLEVGHRRVGRLMGENGIEVKRNKKFKATTDSNHAFNIAPNLLTGTSVQINQTRSGRATSAMSGREKDGSTWLSFLICILGG